MRAGEGAGPAWRACGKASRDILTLPKEETYIGTYLPKDTHPKYKNAMVPMEGKRRKSHDINNKVLS